MALVNWILVIFSPIIGLIVIWKLKMKQRIVFGLAIIASLIVLLGLFATLNKVYFNSTFLNELGFSFFYFSTVYLLCLPILLKKKYIKIPLILLTMSPMIIGIFLGVTGLFAMIYDEFFLSAFTCDRKYKGVKGYSIEVTKLGHALEPEGVNVQVFQRISTTPLKKKLMTKNYYDFFGDISELKFSYHEESGTVEIWTDQNDKSINFNKKIEIKW